MSPDEIEAEVERLIDELAAVDIRRAVTAAHNLVSRVTGREPRDPEDQLASLMMKVTDERSSQAALALIRRAFIKAKPRIDAKAEREEAERKVKARRAAQREWFETNIGRHW